MDSDLAFIYQQLMKPPSHGVASFHPETTKTLFTPARSFLEEFLGTLLRVRLLPVNHVSNLIVLYCLVVTFVFCFQLA